MSGIQQKRGVKKVHKKLARLYITNRRYFLEQVAGGSYIQQKFNLHDNAIKEHLAGKRTLGIYAGQVFTKFISFDIDKDEQHARQIYDYLTNELNIPKQSILTTFSGNKGYHIDLFFNKPIDWRTGKKFYLKVITALDIKENEVEYRPTNKQGVKLPLSTHKRTGKHCYIVSASNLKKLNNEHLMNVKPMNRDEFLDSFEFETSVKLDTGQAERFEHVIERTTLNLPVDYKGRANEMLERNNLIYSSSRHNSTIILLTYLNELGVEQDIAINTVKSVIANTFKEARHLIGNDTTIEYAFSEVERLALYTKGYQLREKEERSFSIYESEILDILKLKRMNLMRQAFIMLIHSKQHATKTNKNFYMTYEQMSERGVRTDNKKKSTAIKRLEELEYLTIVSKNKRKGLHYLPNVYRINKEVQDSSRNVVISTETKVSELEKLITELVSKERVKEYISDSTFYRSFNQLY